MWCGMLCCSVLCGVVCCVVLLTVVLLPIPSVAESSAAAWCMACRWGAACVLRGPGPTAQHQQYVLSSLDGGCCAHGNDEGDGDDGCTSDSATMECCGVLRGFGTELEDWNTVTRRQVSAAGGGGLLDIYKGSLPRALAAMYPNATPIINVLVVEMLTVN